MILRNFVFQGRIDPISWNPCITTALPDNNTDRMISKIRKIVLKHADALLPLLISAKHVLPMTTAKKERAWKSENKNHLMPATMPIHLTESVSPNFLATAQGDWRVTMSKKFHYVYQGKHTYETKLSFVLLSGRKQGTDRLCWHNRTQILVTEFQLFYNYLNKGIANFCWWMGTLRMMSSPVLLCTAW